MSNNQSNIALDAEKNIEILNKKELSALSKDNPNKAYVKQLKIKSPSDNNIKNKDQKTNEHLFHYFYFLMDFIFDKLINPKQFFCISKIYFTVYIFMRHLYDISTYILLFKQLNMNNNILLELLSKDNKKYNPKSFNKINLNDEKLVEKINNDLANKKSIIY